MIRMGQYEYIRTASRMHGKSIKQGCRETGRFRATVRQALWQEIGSHRTRRWQPIGSWVHTWP